MHLTRILIGAVPPFTAQVDVKLDERVNVFVGPNASGKSTLLLALADHFEVLDEGSGHKRPLHNFYLVRVDEDEFGEFLEEMQQSGDVFNIITANEYWFSVRQQNDPLVVHIGSLRVGLPGVLVAARDSSQDYVAEEVLADSFTGLQVQLALETLGIEVWQMEPFSHRLEERRNFLRAIEIADNCSMVVCREVVRDSTTRNYIPGFDMRGFLAHPVADLDNIRVIRGAGINTNDIRDFDILPHQERPDLAAYREDTHAMPVYLGHLSSGTEGTLLWIRWLAFKMVYHHRFKDGWEHQPTILLIDEIENHLHPTWQRRVIPALLEHFPGLQIFATTHSPFVVAGLKAGQVHMLKRDANGVITASTNEHDIIGWTTDEILRTFMGVDEPTDQLTIDRRERLLELRRKDPLTAEEETEMEELRRQVNEDFLSSSTPLEAQRERYGDMMLEFLRSRQSELSQDGS